MYMYIDSHCQPEIFKAKSVFCHFFFQLVNLSCFHYTIRKVSPYLVRTYWFVLKLFQIIMVNIDMVPILEHWATSSKDYPTDWFYDTEGKRGGGGELCGTY